MDINSDSFSYFVKQVMGMMLDGEDHVLGTLRKQYAKSSIAGKEFTGVGFYFYFLVPEQVERLSGKQDFVFGDVYGDIVGDAASFNSSEFGLGFLLYIKNGVIATLEGYTYGDKWPENLSQYQLHYPDICRDLEHIRKEWF